MSRLDFDALWDYEHPDQTEVAFRQLLPQAEHSPDRSYHLQLLTQIARTQSLQRKFAEAHHTLDGVKGALRAELVVPTIRYLLERGRTFNSSGHAGSALTLFQQAWDQAVKHAEAAFFAVDAAHMLAIASGSFEEKIRWNTTALQAASASTDEQARGWCGSLYNNLGWTYHDQGEYERALEYFQQAQEWQQEHGKAREVRIARWCIGRTLRSLQRVTEALALQEDLLAEWDKSEEEPDGYIFEEIAECLLALGRAAESQPYFAQAYVRLRQHQARDHIWFIAGMISHERLEEKYKLSQPSHLDARVGVFATFLAERRRKRLCQSHQNYVQRARLCGSCGIGVEVMPCPSARVCQA